MSGNTVQSVISSIKAGGSGFTEEAVDSRSVGADADLDGENSIHADDSTSDAEEVSLLGQNESEASKEGDTPPDSQASGEAKAPGKSETPSAKEVILVTDDKGRRKVEVDFNNKDEVKKYVQMAFGARKWQAERDQAIQSRKQLETQLAEKDKITATLEATWAERGHEGLVDLLAGKQGAFQDLVNKEIQKREFLKNASPEEIESFRAREAAEAHKREVEKMRKENEDFRKQIAAEKEEADLRAMESRVHPAFDKYRYAGKLGDEHDEQLFDTMLWNTTIDRLTEYENQGQAITPEMIQNEFREVSARLNKRIGVQAEKTVAKVMEQKKREATENVQAKVMSGYKAPSGAAQEAQGMLRDGNLQGIFKNWGKYKSVFAPGKK